MSITLWLAASIVLIAASPILMLTAELVAALTGDRRLPLAVRICVAYFVRELVTLVACGALWLASGAGRRLGSTSMQRLHWRLLRWFIAGIAGSVARSLNIRVAAEVGSEPAADALTGDRPLLVLSRHAGPADTILLLDRLVSHFERRPSVVFKEPLVLDPAVDLLAHRLPHAVLDTDDPADCEARIAQTSARLRDRGVLLMFPEGGNFTPQRRRRALRSLRDRGQRTAAAAGERMQHVMPPRPSGTVAALQGNPDADVVLAAHTGLGLAAFPREIWRNLPRNGTLHTRMWLVPRAEIPDTADEIAAWLNGWWTRIDRWIAECDTE